MDAEADRLMEALPALLAGGPDAEAARRAAARWAGFRAVERRLDASRALVPRPSARGARP